MKQLIKTVFLLSIVIFIISCDSKKENRNPNFLKPLQIEIPKEIENNNDAVEFIKLSENAMNEFSDNIEKLALDNKDLFVKKVEEMETLDQIKLGKITIQFVYNSTQLLNLVENTQKYIENAKINGFNESQIKSLKLIEEAMKKRVEEINNKYKSYFN